MPPDVDIHLGDGADLLAMLDEVIDLYLALRADRPESPLFSRETFRARTTSQAQREGFATTWATSADSNVRLVGFAFGLTFPAGRWWSGNPTLPPPEILDQPKFAVIELDVDAVWQGRGIGRRLLDELLASRSEPYAILTAIPNAPARQMYERWGWVQVGTAQHTPDSPAMDQLVLALSPAAGDGSGHRGTRAP